MANDGGTSRRRRLSRLVKRSFSLAGHRTSVALEPEFWSALSRVAGLNGHTLSGLVSDADAKREPMQPLASALRVLALRAFDPEAQIPSSEVSQAAMPEQGEG
jgi:predicted DNA-binding ribbon-helix-helix protein